MELRRGSHARGVRHLVRGWGNPGAVAGSEYLEEVSRAGSKATAVLECGSGATTLLLGAIGVPTWSLEQHAGWAEKAREGLRLVGARSGRVIDAPLVSYKVADWYRVPDALPDRFDLVICDGPPGDSRGGRSGLWEVLGDRIDGATVLLDDAGRPAESELVANLERAGWTVTLRGSAPRTFAVLKRAARPTN